MDDFQCQDDATLINHKVEWKVYLGSFGWYVAHDFKAHNARQQEVLKMVPLPQVSASLKRDVLPFCSQKEKTVQESTKALFSLKAERQHSYLDTYLCPEKWENISVH